MRALLVSCVVAAGCHAGPLASEPPPITCLLDSAECGGGFVTATTVHNKVDVLFVLDDAPSMSVKLVSLEAAVPALLDGLAAETTPVSYHFGVVTADLGAGPQTLASLGCHPGGDGAKLRDAGGSGGVRFIDDNRINGTSNVADVAAALTALVDVPTTGCEFRQPLEAAYRALHDQLPENASFLRSDAVLVVLFVSDADDCSTAPTTDLFDPTATQYGPLTRFRCTQFGIACNGTPVPPTTVSGLTGCSSLDGGKLLDTQRYIDFFTRPAAQGGVKVDPRDVVLVGITGPSDPVGVHVETPCTQDPSASQCPMLNRSCISPSNTLFAGDPAVRLNAVIRAPRYSNLTSVCDPDDHAALSSLAQLLVSLTSTGCLQSPITLRTDGTPDCTVTDVTAHPDGSVTTTNLPSCAENAHVTPCWQLVDRLPEYDAENCPSPT